MKKFKLLFLFTMFLVPGRLLSKTYSDRTIQETIQILRTNKDLRCSFYQEFLLQTKDGLISHDTVPKPIYILHSVAPKASSESDYATWSLRYSDKSFDFYYYMNSQIGEIRIVDKRVGFSAASDLDFSDLDKDEATLGRAKLIRTENVQVTHPKTYEKVVGNKITYLIGHCHKRG